MKWEVVTAKSGEPSLILNGTFIYSRYRPREDAWRWIDAEFDSTKESYLLIGLGLGYHAERLIQLAQNKTVNVYYFDEQERLFSSIPNVVDQIQHLDLSESCQILMPNVWLKALHDHSLLPFLEDIKINQVTYKKTAHLLQENFEKNVKLQDFQLFNCERKKMAALVASGPSLQQTIQWLKKIDRHVDVFVVGSALKVVVENGIQPTAVLISDPKPNIGVQLKNVSYNGPLLYLSTANHLTVKSYTGPRYIICQRGYRPAEMLASDKKFPLIETGGSVATMAFSVIEQLGYETLILFGQDLAFTEHRTHVQGATSGRIVTNQSTIQKIQSNAGIEVFTLPNLQTYLRWFNRHIQQSTMNVYNTALYGAKIEGAPYITEEQLYHLVEKPMET